jgi:hypothetical protein
VKENVMPNWKLEGACSLGCSALLIACASAVSLPSEGPDVSDGDAPLARRCATITVERAQDLVDVRDCREIDGDLLLRADDLDAVSAQSLPHLRRIAGSLISLGSGPLREIVLPALREVGADDEDVLELALDASTLERIELPALERVNGNLGIAALGALHTLDLSSLEHVSGVLGLVNLPNLADLRLPDGVRAERAAFEYLCEWPVDALPDLPARLRDVGCCTQSTTDCGSTICRCVH